MGLLEWLKAFLDRINKWRKQEDPITVFILNIRQTRNGTALPTHPIKLKGIVIGEETSGIVESNGCFRVTHHPSWYKALIGKENLDNCQVKKQLVKTQDNYAILITNAPLEAKA